MPRINRISDDVSPIRLRRSVNSMTAPTRLFSMKGSDQRSFTVPADSEATAASNARNIRALIDVLADKGLISVVNT